MCNVVGLLLDVVIVVSIRRVVVRPVSSTCYSHPNHHIHK